jgi:oligopeptide/dipeptide ABC transporter ATP-binding protein
MSTAETETRPAPERKPGGEPLLRLANLKKYFPITRGILIQRRIGNVHAVDGVDLEVHPGETVGVVGETGCGKSTVARLTTKLHEPTDGSVVFDGRDISGPPRVSLPAWVRAVSFGTAAIALILAIVGTATSWPPTLVTILLIILAISLAADAALLIVGTINGWRRRRFHRQIQELRSEFQMIFQDPYASLNPRKTIGSIIGDPMHIHGIPGQGRFKPLFGTVARIGPWLLAALAFVVWLVGMSAEAGLPGFVPLGLLGLAVAIFVLGRLLIRPARKKWNAAVKKEVQRLMELVGLNPEHYNRFPHEFSGGQRQRIGVARALALRPRLIVCDEPVSALDVSIQAQILNLLEDLQEEFNLTYVFIAHDLSVVKHMSDRVAVMYLGRIVEIAPGDTLYENPKHPYTGALLSAVPIPDPNLAAAKRRIILEGDVPSPIDPPSGCRFHPRCPRAQFPICKENDPELTPHHRGQLAACHFPLEDRAVIQSTA